MDVLNNFIHYATLVPDDRFKQGIGIEVYGEPRVKGTHGVYYLSDITSGDVVKIGETRCIRNRFHTQYRHVRNITNDKIRHYIKTQDALKVWIYEVPTYIEEVLGYEVPFTPIYDLERQIIQEYKRLNDDTLPLLNSIGR